MSVGSVHSRCGRMPCPVMRAALRRFWISPSSRFACSRTASTKAWTRWLLLTDGIWSSTLVDPMIEASGVRSSCVTVPISASRSESACDLRCASSMALATSRRPSVTAASEMAASTRRITASRSSCESRPRSTIAARPTLPIETARTSQSWCVSGSWIVRVAPGPAVAVATASRHT